MTDLAICLGPGKGTWSEAIRVIASEKWQNIFIITNTFGREKFAAPQNAQFIVVDDLQGVAQMSAAIKDAMKGKVSDLEVGLNIISGTGKVHMAMIQAILDLGFGLRLVH